MVDRTGKERAYAESVTDQNVEAFVDELRGLLAENPGFLRRLVRLINLSNTAASRVIDDKPKRDRRELLLWLIPAARIGLSQSLMAMEDKYREPAEGGESDG